MQLTCQLGDISHREKGTSAGICQGQRNGSFTLAMYQSIPSTAKAKNNLHSKEFKVRNKQKCIKIQHKKE